MKFATILILFSLATATLMADEPTDPVFSIPVVDLDQETDRQVVVDREAGQYLGHPTTVLLEDDRTILCVYPKGHGKGAIMYKRSSDGGRTWTDRLPTPENWATSLETPTIHRVVDSQGKKRLIIFSGLHPVRMAVSEDDGASWSPLNAIGNFGGIVTMSSVVELRTGPGHYLALFHDDGRFFHPPELAKRATPPVMTLYQTQSVDGGMTWSTPKAIFQSAEVHLCEPGAIRSPDGKQIAVLLRENRRVKNSHIIFTSDEGKTWSEPRTVPNELTGDRHVGTYAPDGRLFISFRDVSPKGRKSPTEGDWVGWVGRYEDLVEGKPGQYRVRLKDNLLGSDCAYPGVECQKDGTFVTTTYGHWTKGESPFILSVRFSLGELDAKAKQVGDPAKFRGAKAGDECIVEGLKLCWCPPGKFMMGSPKNEIERRPGEEQVEVTLSRGYWISKFEATQGDWKRIMGDLPGELTEQLPAGEDYPVGNVNFPETLDYCSRLTEAAHKSRQLPIGWEFRLPTEAQWEYACRAGTTSATAFGDKLSSVQANFKGKPYNGADEGPSIGRATRVGAYPANAWGIHDMHGNIFEWCRDWYCRRLPGGTDPDLFSAIDKATKSEDGGISRSRRGGCWSDDGWPCRSAFRLRFEPERRYDHIGFRVVAVEVTRNGKAAQD